VVKRFRSWDRGEPDREWRGLSLLQTYAPGLAPEPIQRRTEDGHIESWLTGAMDADALLGRLDLDAETLGRIRTARRMFALHWLVMLLPGKPGHLRNPPGSVERQAQRLLDLLGSRDT
ncbi:MAG TPA: hypothetical protein VFR22_02610, partial [Nocardioidaceae bacterium]|nr:hypothetical protein [Nocardioidaceae bacterium]